MRGSLPGIRTSALPSGSASTITGPEKVTRRVFPLAGFVYVVCQLVRWIVKPLRLPFALVNVVVVRNPSERTTNSNGQSASAGIVVVRSTGCTTRVGGSAAAGAEKMSANAATTMTPTLPMLPPSSGSVSKSVLILTKRGAVSWPRAGGRIPSEEETRCVRKPAVCSGVFEALFRTRTGDPLLTMEVQRSEGVWRDVPARWLERLRSGLFRHQ